MTRSHLNVGCSQGMGTPRQPLAVIRRPVRSRFWRLLFAIVFYEAYRTLGMHLEALLPASNPERPRVSGEL